MSSIFFITPTMDFMLAEMPRTIYSFLIHYTKANATDILVKFQRVCFVRGSNLARQLLQATGD